MSRFDRYKLGYRVQKSTNEIAQDIDFEIEKPQSEEASIKPESLMRDYKDIALFSMDPQVKKEILFLLKEVKSDLQRVKSIIANFNN
jgi:hypothetical protein